MTDYMKDPMAGNPHRATKVESMGSLWWLDDEAGCYMRMPKEEAPREKPEWSDERAGVLQDFVWHPMEGWEIINVIGAVAGGELLISYRDERTQQILRAYAPGARVVDDHWH